jgi:hypothetical protein
MTYYATRLVAGGIIEHDRGVIQSTVVLELLLLALVAKINAFITTYHQTAI